MPALVLLFALTFAASPLWVPGFGGFNADQFPVPQIDPPVQPAGYAFAIWGIIYLWLVVSAGFGVFVRRDAPEWAAMRPPLALSLAVGSIWLPVAVISPVWATILIWVMLIPALIALWRCPRTDLWAAAWPLGLYAGWLSAASCVAVGLLLNGYNLLSADLAAILVLGIASVLAAQFQSRLGYAPTYGIAVVWALAAVIVQNGIENIVGRLALFGSLIVVISTMRAALIR